MNEDNEEFPKYFEKIANRIKEQGSEVRHWYREIDFNDILKKIMLKNYMKLPIK